MICPTCKGSGWMKQGFPGGFRPTQCHTCGGHGELVPPISLFECVECGKKMNKCKCKPLAETNNSTNS